MNDFEQYRSLWHSADTSRLPEARAIKQLAHSFRNQKLKKKWLVITLATIFAALVITVLFTNSFKLSSTYIGGSLMALSAILLAIDNLRSLKRFYRADDRSNSEFLAFIEQTRRNQVRYYQRTMVLILIPASAGWMLYLYEVVYSYPAWLYGTYAFAIIYLALLWFIVRPRAFRRDAEKLDALRQHTEKLNQQLKNEIHL